MIKKTITDEFFTKAILKGDESIYETFAPFVTEKQVGPDVFFEIDRSSEHFRINQRITRFILSRIPINSAACGFVPGKSYFDFLRPHIGGYYFLRLDIKKFFHSILADDVREFLGDYFSDEKGGFFNSPFGIASRSILHKVTVACPDTDLRGKEVLPMGFSSSPVISNIIFRRIDIQVQKYCEGKGIVYSRYADDMLFSSGRSSFIHGDQFEKEISIYISQLSLRLKKSKRKAATNTISLNGYVIQNTKSENGLFLKLYDRESIGSIRLSNKKLKIIKKLVSELNNKKSHILIMEQLFGLNREKALVRFRNSKRFYGMYAKDQMQNKLRGYRSYLVSLLNYQKKYSCVDHDCLSTVTKLVGYLESNIS